MNENWLLKHGAKFIVFFTLGYCLGEAYEYYEANKPHQTTQQGK